MLHSLSQPTRFMRLAAKVSPWIAAASLVLIVAGLIFALFYSPPDYQQKDSVRIMYIHVPSAWLALSGYTFLAVASAVGLIWRAPLAHMAAEASAPVGACFTFLALATGSLWGKPMWGTWWAWDARMTSVLILFFLYLGYIALNSAFDDQTRGTKSSAILAVVGVVMVPIIKFSVDWWNTLHQGASIIKMGGPSVHPAMLIPLFLMVGGFTLLFAWIVLIRMRAAFNQARIRAIRFRQVHG